MAVTVTINGTDRTAWLADGTLDIDKHFGVEVLEATLYDRGAVSSAFRPTLGHAVRVTHDSGLVFEGPIVEVEERPLLHESGTAIRLTAKDYTAVLATIVVDRLSIPAQDVLLTWNNLFDAYLDPLGYTNLSAASGGPSIDAIEVEHQTLADVLAQIAQLAGWFVRINGDKEADLVNPGTLAAPVVLSVANGNIRQDGIGVSQSRVQRATRLWVRTGGTGTTTYTTSMVGNGTITTFPVPVEPSTAPTQVTEGVTTYTLGGGTWSWDATALAIVRSSALGNGTTVSVSYPVEFPAWVRVWDAGTQTSTGAFSPAVCVDAIVEAAEQTDLGQARAWATAELARRVSQPKRVALVTDVPGFYPLQEVTITISDRGITGAYLVERVRVAVEDSDRVLYELTCVEGDVLGRAWFEYFKQRSQTTGGGVAVTGTATTGGGSTSTSTGVARIPLGGDNYFGDNPTSWTDVPNAIPVRFGGAAMAGTWTLRGYRRVTHTTSPTTAVELRLYDATNAVVLASLTGTTSTTFASATTTFAAPLTEGVVLLQYRITGGGSDPAEARVGQCSLEKD
jgi:hypothetical protein